MRIQETAQTFTATLNKDEAKKMCAMLALAQLVANNYKTFGDSLDKDELRAFVAAFGTLAKLDTMQDLLHVDQKEFDAEIHASFNGANQLGAALGLWAMGPEGREAVNRVKAALAAQRN